MRSINTGGRKTEWKSKKHLQFRRTHVRIVPDNNSKARKVTVETCTAPRERGSLAVSPLRKDSNRISHRSRISEQRIMESGVGYDVFARYARVSVQGGVSLGNQGGTAEDFVPMLMHRDFIFYAEKENDYEGKIRADESECNP